MQNLQEPGKLFGTLMKQTQRYFKQYNFKVALSALRVRMIFRNILDQGRKQGIPRSPPPPPPSEIV